MCSDEPEFRVITAGDTIAWTRGLSLYPASAGWTLQYNLSPVGACASTSPITFDATASGDAFAVSVTAATTGAWTPGRYVWAASVTNTTSGQRFTVARGSLQILPNPAIAAAPTHAQQTLTLIEAALVGRIPRGLEDTTIDGQQLVRIPIKDLYTLREKYRAEVADEQRSALAAGGAPVRRTIYVAFER